MHPRKWIAVLKTRTRITGSDLFKFLLASLLALSLEALGDHILESEAMKGFKGHHVAGAQSLFELKGMYQRLLTGGPRKPISKFTILVEVNAGNDRYYHSLFDQLLDACERRGALADVIQKIASASPAVIVLDAQFARAQCRKDSAQTAYLKRVMTMVSSMMPLVVGRKIDPDTGQLIPALAFSDTTGHPVIEGLLHFDPDTKKLPLKWPVTKDSNPSTAQPAYDFEDTLALKVAQAYDPQLMTKYPKIKEFTDRKNAPSGDATHPYISFLQPEQFLSYTAGELLCGKNYAIATKEGAAKYCDPFPAALKNLRGKIVVVGGREEKDKHLSPIGEVDGFVLHANYIEALLDQRYFTPVHSLVNLFFGILVFIAILSSLRVPDPVKRVVMLMMTLAISYLSIFFLVMFLGFYLNPTFVSGSWLVIIIAHHVYENVLHRS